MNWSSASSWTGWPPPAVTRPTWPGAARSAATCSSPTRWSRTTAPARRPARPRRCWTATLMSSSAPSSWPSRSKLKADSRELLPLGDLLLFVLGQPEDPAARDAVPEVEAAEPVEEARNHHVGGAVLLGERAYRLGARSPEGPGEDTVQRSDAQGAESPEGGQPGPRHRYENAALHAGHGAELQLERCQQTEDRPDPEEDLGPALLPDHPVPRPRDQPLQE